MNDFSLVTLFIRFKWRISATLVMIATGAGLELLFPLAIGVAIDGLLEGDAWSVLPLAALGLGALIVGSAQRFYDTRIYAGIYRRIAPEMVAHEQNKGSDLSSISARTDLLNEFVEFLEAAMPEMVQALVNLAGALILIAFLDTTVFIACLVLLALMILIFHFSGPKNYRLNAGFNDEFEQRVKILKTENSALFQNHISRLMKWTIRLSDLETLNFFILFLGVIALLVFTPWVVVETGGGVNGGVQYGMVFSVLMYVLSYIESLTTCPIFIQQVIRLHEISTRLSQTNVDSGAPSKHAANTL